MKLEIHDDHLEIVIETEQDIAYFRDTLGLGYLEDGNTFNKTLHARYDDWKEDGFRRGCKIIVKAKE